MDAINFEATCFDKLSANDYITLKLPANHLITSSIAGFFQ